jgi:CRISPR/Cas system-associated exonuclease Cas4 (RecB family)
MTGDLRERTFAAASRAFELLKAGRMPPPLERAARCHDCSLEDVCLPRETKLLTARKRIGR